MKRAAIYARYSSHHQDGNTTIETQLEACKVHAGADALVYIDRAVSGTHVERESFQQMLRDCQAGMIDVVWVYKFDRFARSAGTALVIIDDLKAISVSVRSVTEGEDSLARGIQLVVAEDFSNKIGERSALGRKARFKQGLFSGGVCPYGYKVIEKKLFVDPETAEHVRWIFERYHRDNIGFDAIANLLNARAVKPPRKELWTGGQIRYMLRNTKYKGTMTHGRYPNQKQRRRGQWQPKDETTCESYHDESIRIVSDELWDACQAKATCRRKIRTPHNQVRVFTGLLTCGCCGKRLTRCPSDSREKFVYWKCWRRRNFGREACQDPACISETHLSDWVRDGLGRLLDDTATIERAVEILADNIRFHQRDATALTSKLRRLETEVEGMTATLIDTALDDPDARRAIGRQLGERERDLVAMRNRVEMVRAQGVTREDAHRRIMNTVDDLKHDLNATESPSEFNELVRVWVGPMVINRGSDRPRPLYDAPERPPGLLSSFLHLLQRIG